MRLAAAFRLFGFGPPARPAGPAGWLAVCLGRDAPRPPPPRPAAAMAPTMAPTPTLGELMQQSQILSNHFNHSDLPTIQLGLDQIETQSRRLAGRATTVPAGLGAGDDLTGTDTTRAHYFLANGGIDAAELADTIQATRVANAFEPLRPLDDTDVAGYLRHEHEQVILSALEDGRRETQDAFCRIVDRSLRKNWDAQKRRIVEDFGTFTVPSAPAVSGTLSPPQNLAGSADTSTSLQVQAKMLRYVLVVQRLNDARLADDVFPLLHAYSEATSSVPDAIETLAGVKLAEAWRILQDIVREIDVVGGQFTRGAVAQREYAPAYNDPHVYLASSQGLSLRQEIIQGSMRYLQNHFLEHINATISRNPVKAQMGGRPTVRNRVVAYCRVKYLNPDGTWSPQLETATTPEGKSPIWAHIFFLLRTGHEEEALQVAVESEALLHRSDHSFVGLFKAWLDSPDRILPKSFRDRLFADYNSRFRTSSPDSPADDPFKLALYKLMGRFEVRKRFPSSLTSNSGNWLWLQLAMVREPPVVENSLFGASSATLDEGGIAGRDSYTLGYLASIVTSYGEAHFDPKGNNPYNYFQLLLLVGQFERAIAFLFSRGSTQVEAVQFAIALTYYGLLRVPQESKASQLDYLSVDAESPDLAATGTPASVGITYFNFARLIQRYTRSFAETDPREALHHVYLIALNSDASPPIAQEQMDRCLSMVRQVVLDSKDYYALLGDPRNDGSVAQGAIAKYSKLLNFPDETNFLKSIVAAAAASAERGRQVKDAVLLYNLAAEYDRVIAVLNKELGNHLMDVDNTSSRPLGAALTKNLAPGTSLQAATDLPAMAHEILASYERQSHVLRKINPQRRETLRLLLQLKQAVGAYIAGDLETALTMIESTDVIPLKADVMTVTRKADEWKSVDTALSLNLSELLLMTMTILSKLHAALWASLYSDPARQRSVNDLRTKARTLLTYAGQLRLRMSADTYSQLISLSPQW